MNARKIAQLRFLAFRIQNLAAKDRHERLITLGELGDFAEYFSSDSFQLSANPESTTLSEVFLETLTPAVLRRCSLEELYLLDRLSRQLLEKSATRSSKIKRRLENFPRRVRTTIAKRLPRKAFTFEEMHFIRMKPCFALLVDVCKERLADDPKRGVWLCERITEMTRALIEPLFGSGPDSFDRGMLLETVQQLLGTALHFPEQVELIAELYELRPECGVEELIGLLPLLEQAKAVCRMYDMPDLLDRLRARLREITPSPETLEAEVREEFEAFLKDG